MGYETSVGGGGSMPGGAAPGPSTSSVIARARSIYNRAREEWLLKQQNKQRAIKLFFSFDQTLRDWEVAKLYKADLSYSEFMFKPEASGAYLQQGRAIILQDPNKAPGFFDPKRYTDLFKKGGILPQKDRPITDKVSSDAPQAETFQYQSQNKEYMDQARNILGNKRVNEWQNAELEKFWTEKPNVESGSPGIKNPDYQQTDVYEYYGVDQQGNTINEMVPTGPGTQGDGTPIQEWNPSMTSGDPNVDNILNTMYNNPPGTVIPETINQMDTSAVSDATNVDLSAIKELSLADAQLAYEQSLNLPQGTNVSSSMNDYTPASQDVQATETTVDPVQDGTGDTNVGGFGQNAMGAVSVAGSIGTLMDGKRSIHDVKAGANIIGKLAPKSKIGGFANKALPWLTVATGAFDLLDKDSTDAQKLGGAMSIAAGVAMTNFWNPAGWVTAALAIGGTLLGLFGGKQPEQPKNVSRTQPNVWRGGTGYSFA